MITKEEALIKADELLQSGQCAAHIIDECDCDTCLRRAWEDANAESETKLAVQS